MAQPKPKALPRVFLAVPWRELLDLHVRVNKGLSAEGVTFSMSELVNTWMRAIGEPRGFRIRRWHFDDVADRVLMDLEWRRKTGGHAESKRG